MNQNRVSKNIELDKNNSNNNFNNKFSDCFVPDKQNKEKVENKENIDNNLRSLLLSSSPS